MVEYRSFGSIVAVAIQALFPTGRMPQEPSQDIEIPIFCDVGSNSEACAARCTENTSRQSGRIVYVCKRQIDEFLPACPRLAGALAKRERGNRVRWP